MYFGSVRFFKHLIVTFFILLITIPTIIAVVFAVKYHILKTDKAPVPVVEAKPRTPDELVSELLSPQNLSEDDILNLFESRGMDFRDAIFKEHFSVENNELSYQQKYPDLYVDAPKSFECDENVVYLTFDDGPSSNTRDVLNILDKYEIKATFFVVGNENLGSKQYLNQIVERGHTLGVHTYSHDFNQIYDSVDAYLDDFYKAFNYVYEETGVKPNIFRFPGGSVNAFNINLYQQIAAEMSRRGFVYYDWNVSGEDASADATWTSIYNNVLSSLKGKDRAVVLLHDGPNRHTTVTTLEDLIKNITEQGYTFDKLTHTDEPITFGYID